MTYDGYHVRDIIKRNRRWEGRVVLFKWHHREQLAGRAPPRKVLYAWANASGGTVEVWRHGVVKGDYHLAVGIADKVAREWFVRHWPAAILKPPTVPRQITGPKEEP